MKRRIHVLLIITLSCLFIRALAAAQAEEAQKHLAKFTGSYIATVRTWNDPDAEHGVGAKIIKGEGTLEVMAHKGESQKMAVTAVRCGSAEEAEAMRRVFGDTSNPH